MVNRMNITTQDKDVLKHIKQVVERIEKAGKLPQSVEENQDMLDAWNKAYKKNDKLNNCPSCRQSRFVQLRRTYDLFNLKDQFNKTAPVKKQQENSTKSTKTPAKKTTAKKRRTPRKK